MEMKIQPVPNKLKRSDFPFPGVLNEYKIQIDRQCYAVGLLVVFSNLVHYTTLGTRNLQNFIKYLERKEKVKRVHIDLWD